MMTLKQIRKTRKRIASPDYFWERAREAAEQVVDVKVDLLKAYRENQIETIRVLSTALKRIEAKMNWYLDKAYER